MPAWVLGIVARYCLLLPLRMLCLLLGFVVFGLTFPLVKLAGLTPCARGRTQAAEVALVQLLASAFVASWHGVVRFHGIRPSPPADGGKGKAGGGRQGIFVANHSSMIDFIILLQSHPYAVVGQKHGGWVGFMQVRRGAARGRNKGRESERASERASASVRVPVPLLTAPPAPRPPPSLAQDHVLSAIKCVWFNRGESEDKRTTADRMVAHVREPANAKFPLLIFPEGTCVNNEYVVQFKKFVFQLGVPIHPIAIK